MAAAASEHLERALLQLALKQSGGGLEEPAAQLGLSRQHLYLKRQRLGVEPPESAVVSVRPIAAAIVSEIHAHWMKSASAAGIGFATAAV